MSVALAFTTHDPRGDLLKVASERLPKITSIYSEMYAVPTNRTDGRLTELLKSHGVHVVTQVDGEGLEYEDWLKLPEDQKMVKGIEEFKMHVDRNPENWVNRMRWALDIAGTAMRVYRELTSKS